MKKRLTKFVSWVGFSAHQRAHRVCEKPVPGYHVHKSEIKEIHRAAYLGASCTVEELLSRKKNVIDSRDRKKRTALHLACTRGQSSVVALLIQWRCDLDASDEEGKTALIKAVQCRKEVCVTILLEHGADPNLVDDCQNTALHYAVLAEDTSIAAKLLHYKADIEAINKYKYTPLLLAIRENKEEMVKFLIENGANVHAVDKLQRSALMLAVHHDSPEIVKLLLEKRVNTDLLDLHGWFAGRYACYNGFKHLYQLIVDYRAGRIPNTPPQNSDLGQSSAKKSLPSSHTGAENIQEKLQLSGKDDKEEMVVKLGTSNGSCMDPLKNVEQKTDLVVEISLSHEDISVIRVSPKRDIDDSRPPSDDDLALAPKDTMDFELSDPKDSSEVLPQQLPEAERQFRGPEIELHPRRDALRPTTLVLQCVHRDRGQAQRSNKETEPLSQSKQGDVIKYIAKQPFLKETIWKLQSENTLLRQQLEVARNEARSEKTIFNTPEPFLDHMGKLEAMSTRVLMLEEGNKELIKECRCLKDRLSV
ncbi:uncharacterized protein [Vicugna pacos]|uniref:Uncharacterized protein isoform X1 n=1 Tax=Vicugna pacos TaxID=30538 RepID=A0ABM5CC61_VICPA